MKNILIFFILIFLSNLTFSQVGNCDDVFQLAIKNVLKFENKGSFDRSFTSYISSETFRKQLNTEYQKRLRGGGTGGGSFGIFGIKIFDIPSIDLNNDKEISKTELREYSNKWKSYVKQNNTASWMRKFVREEMPQEAKVRILDSWDNCNSGNLEAYKFKAKLDYLLKLKELQSRQRGLIYFVEEFDNRIFNFDVSFRRTDPKSTRTKVKITSIDIVGGTFNPSSLYVGAEFSIGKTFRIRRKANAKYLDVFIETDLETPILYYIDFEDIVENKTIAYKNGIFKGEIVNGLPNGKGSFDKRGNGQHIYEGDFKNGEFIKGKYYRKEDCETNPRLTERGNFKGLELHGQGEKYFWYCYDGTVSNYHLYKKGEFLKGNMFNGFQFGKDGEIWCKYTNGSEKCKWDESVDISQIKTINTEYNPFMNGIFLISEDKAISSDNAKAEIKGTYIKDDIVYNGRFIEGNLVKGKIFVDGIILMEGEFKNGLLNGEGTKYYSAVRYEKGQFYDGILINGALYYYGKEVYQLNNGYISYAKK